MYKFPLVLALSLSSLSPSLRHHRPTFMLLSQSSVSIWNFFPPISLCNKTEIPSGVRRDSRGNSVQWGVEALSSCVFSLAERCIGRRQETERQWEKAIQPGSQQAQPAFSFSLTGRWAETRSVSLCAILRSLDAVPLNPSHPPSEFTPCCRSLSEVV